MQSKMKVFHSLAKIAWAQKKVDVLLLALSVSTNVIENKKKTTNNSILESSRRNNGIRVG